MKLARPVVRQRAAALAILWLACGTPAVLAAGRAACTPRPAAGDVASQSADALSLGLDAAHPAALANWDAGRWQRHRVWITLQASNQGDAPAFVLPQMVVDAHADGSAASVLAGVALSIAPHERAAQRLAIYVPDDARTLGVRALLAAPAQPVAVTFALECSDARFDLGEFAPSVAAALDEAVKTWFNNFADPLSDPSAALATVRQLASGAQDAGDVVWTLRGLMQTVGDDHGFIVGPGEPVPERRTLPTRAPEFEMRADGIAVVRLHAIDTRAAAASLAWAAALHEGIAGLAARRPRAWVVDLRDHDAPGPWPSFAGLSALLDGPAVGAYVSRHERQDWIVDRGAARIAGTAALVDLQSPPEPGIRAPVAVLIGPNTRDGGEDVTVAFRGRPHTRFFGAPTAGFPFSGVRVHRLADGTTLGVLETRDADRTGQVQRLPIEPEAPMPTGAAPDMAVERALDWLAGEVAAASANH
jgi:carboxyl-terminal processing protease